MRALAGALTTLIVLIHPPASAADDERDTDETPEVVGQLTPGGLSAELLEGGQRDLFEEGHAQSSSQAPQSPSLQLGDAFCPTTFAVDALFYEIEYCQIDAEPVTPTTPVLTIGLVRRAFAELKLPAGTLVIEPPDGLTLVNFDTNFYTTSTNPISRTVTLLGRAVTLQATPDTYTWNFDDGQTLTTSRPGAPYPRLDITHNYLRKGSYRPRLSTTYTGRYRVGTGPWHQIPGTVTIDGTGQPLRAIEAQPKLVGY